MVNEVSPTKNSFIVEVRDGVLWIEWVTNATVTDHEASALVGRAAALGSDRCPPMLVMLNGMVSLSRGALEMFSHGLKIAAMALVGPSPVDRLLASYFTEVHEPPYPTRHFDTAEDALVWLTGHLHP